MRKWKLSDLSFQRAAVQLPIQNVKLNEDCVADNILMTSKKMSKKQLRQNFWHILLPECFLIVWTNWKAYWEI